MIADAAFAATADGCRFYALLFFIFITYTLSMPLSMPLLSYATDAIRLCR